MNKIKTLVIASLFFFSGTYLTNAQDAISQSTSATARIVAPLGFSLDGVLAFGDIAKPTSAASGTVTLNPKNKERELDGVTNVGAGDDNDNFSLPTYTVTGEVGLAFTLTLPDDNAVTLYLLEEDDVNGWSVTATENEENDEMEITNFTSYRTDDDAPITTATRSQNIGDDDDANKYVVGATLNVKSTQTTGYYRGTFAVTAQYD